MSAISQMQRSSAAALAAATGAAIYAPHSPPESQPDDCQPLDFSKASAGVKMENKVEIESSDEECYVDVQQQPKKLVSNKFAGHCFTTPSPSPPERNLNNVSLHHGNESIQSSLQKQQQAPPPPLAEQLNAQIMQSALMSMMQSSSFNPSLVSPELLQNILKQSSNLAIAQQHQQSVISPTAKSPNSTTSGSFFEQQQQQQLSPRVVSPNHLLSSLAHLTGAGGGNVSQISPGSTANSSANSVVNGNTAAAVAAAALGGLSMSSFPLDPAVVALTTSKKSLLNSIPAVSTPMLAATTPSKFGPAATSSVSSTNGNGSLTTPSPVLPFKSISPSGGNFNSGALPIPIPDALANQSIILSNTDPAYQEYRNKVLAAKQQNQHSRKRKSSLSSNATLGQQSHQQQHLGESDDNSNCGSNSSFSEMDSHLNGSGMSQQQEMSPAQQQPDSNGRKRARPMPYFLKDEAYWERRRKNNEAAKRSRDLRRAKEDEIAIRCTFLEQENLRLKYDLMQTRIELDKIRALWLNSQGVAAAAAQALNGKQQE